MMGLEPTTFCMARVGTRSRPCAWVRPMGTVTRFPLASERVAERERVRSVAIVATLASVPDDLDCRIDGDADMRRSRGRRSGDLERRRVAEFEAKRRGGLTADGLAPGWADADWLSPKAQMVLRRFARLPHRGGGAYQTILNGSPVAVLRSGRIVSHTGDKT
jgi:hypothetical protein